MFYILLPDGETRDALLDHLRSQRINAVFHYVPLHSSPIGRKAGRSPRYLPVTDDLATRLIRLPFYYEITQQEQEAVAEAVTAFLRASCRRRAGPQLERTAV